MSWTVWYKLIGTEVEVEVSDVCLCGLHPDYPIPVYFIRHHDGEQTEIPVSSLLYIKFSKERFGNTNNN